MKTKEQILEEKIIQWNRLSEEKPYLTMKILSAMEEYADQFRQPPVSGSLPLTEEKKLELILRKYHGHTKEQWENELAKQYPYCEIPHLVESVWKAAQGNDR